MAEDQNTQEYRVLARKYRPADFDSLIGQEAMVQTLSNAIDTGRLAHAFILTGVRGVGKTTTARIIAKALNCLNTDGPSINPCGTCENCTSIAESRHVDVLEMDAASRTGVDDIREIIESVRYAPVSARFKIYIIDEVHMLSKSAFNALLKTLEEPPAHVKFIFATTEIRKLPVTVLSRCQRFDLKRVEAETLIAHLAKLVANENCEAEEGALKLIARAAEGSVRDSLSLLDQAIAHGAGKVTEGQVRDMLGLADRAQILDLFEQIMSGDIKAAITTLRAQYDRGADPSVVINDLLEVAHWLTRLKVTPDTGVDTLVSEAEKSQGGAMAEKLGMPHLTRAWQMLLKGLGEVRIAPSPIAAAEMVLIRLGYAANGPSPADLVKKLQSAGAGAPNSGSTGAMAQTGNMAPQASIAGMQTGSAHNAGMQPTMAQASQVSAQQSGAQVLAFKQNDAGDHAKYPMPISFEKMVEMFRHEKEGVLAVSLKDHVRLVDFQPGKLTINPSKRAPQDLVMRVKLCLKEWTGEDWIIAIEKEGGDTTIRDKEIARDKKMRDEALEEPIVKALMETFEGAELLAVREFMDASDDLMMGMANDQEISDASTESDEASDFDF
ncbi:DNA polymerase III subunit gamma/tau [Kordiimonas sp. SCSIO 12610]|uniref:DNA polymerase III subunit gamma/tau n=1 Tax=Kordiimonas sp. SCSIO 12610 TaxID=2829597 RepID=UPI00210BB347|nr:DNA polymerase III subunit gamma/tau [Kordiimonas sp. SCSIO 12610]UTW55186.1 DNA polymerase III subunit gamma/tau [Kordiimonas sp. SCSIO 12610]